MKDRNILIWNTLAFSALSFFVAGLQTAFWPSILRVFYGANLWIFITIYICIYRRFHHALIFTYVNTLILHSYTSVPFGVLLVLQILLLAFCNFLRSRIFWTTASYYLIVCAISVLLFEIAFMFLSYFFEPVPAVRLAWRETVVTIFLSPALGFLFFSFGRLIDTLLPPPQVETASV